MTAPRLSPGRLTALWLILRSVRKLGPGASTEELVAFARRSGLRSGGLPVTDGYELALAGGFLFDQNGLRLSWLGDDVLRKCDDDEPNTDVLRQFMAVLVLREPPPWVACWQGDPDMLPFAIPDAVRELLHDAGLQQASTTGDLAAWAWWNALRCVPFFEQTIGVRKAVGDTAEIMTIEYERNRLRAEGFPELAERVRWAACESPAFGFDVLSFAGRRYADQQSPTAELALEVKATTLTAIDTFRFFMTRYEWMVANTLGRRYRMYLWRGVVPNASECNVAKGPYVIGSTMVEPHIPALPPCREPCRWESAMISLATAELPKPLRFDHDGTQ